MNDYEKLKGMLCDELEQITRKGELTAGSLDTVDKLTHAIKSVATIMAMEDEYGYGYSRADGDYTTSGRRYSYAGRGRGARRDSMGRYTSRGGYSYDDARDDMVKELRELMNDAPDEQTKKEFQRFISKMESM